MKKLFRPALGLLALGLVACGSDSNVVDPHAALYGTWASGRPATLGQRGAVWHSYHADGTLTSNVNIVDDGPGGSGCRTSSRYVGRFGGTTNTLDIIQDFGTMEVAHCTDPAKNVPERAFTANELTQAGITGLSWSLAGDVLTLGGAFNHSRVHPVVVPSTQAHLSPLYGTWSSGRPATLGFRGAVWHSYHTDGTLTSNVNIVDDGPAGSGCRTSSRYVGRFAGTANTLDITQNFGTTEVAHCADPTKNAPERALTATELTLASIAGLSWSVSGDVLTLGGTFSHASVHGPVVPR